MAVAAAIVIVLLLARPQPESLRVELADQVALVLPDGTRRAAVAGESLDEGTVVLVGPDGSAVIDGTVLAAGSTAEIVDGRVVVRRSGDEARPDGTDGRPPTTPVANSDPPPSSADSPADPEVPGGSGEPRPDPTQSTPVDLVPPSRPRPTSPPTTVVRRPPPPPATTTTQPSRPTTTERAPTTAAPRTTAPPAPPPTRPPTPPRR